MNDFDKFLQHVGILGMKWGIRRARRSGSTDHLTARSLKRKRLADMSNEEIRALTTRMQLETQYKSLNPGRISRGKDAVSNVLKAIGGITTAAGTITAGYKLAKTLYYSEPGQNLIKKIKKSP